MFTFISNEKGTSIIITMLVILMMSTLAFTSVGLFSIDTSITQEAYQSSQSLYVAESGIQCALETEIDGDNDWSDAADFTGSVGGVSFSVAFSNKTADSIDITCTATDGQSTRSITQSFTRVSSGPPSAFNYVVHGTNNINMNNTSGSINGDISSGSGHIHLGSLVLNNCTPDIGSGVGTPVVDYTGYYSETPISQVVTGNKTFSAGTYTGLWYIDGNATLDSNVTFNGTLVVTGNLSMSQEQNINFHPTNNYPAIICGNNIQAQRLSNSNFNGLVFDEGNNSIMNNMTNVSFNGTLVAANNVNMNNATNINFNYDSSILTNPPPYITESGASGSASIDKSSWKENY